MNKKALLALGIAIFAMVGCEKPSGNKGVISRDNISTKTEHGSTYTERIETYKGTDGTPVKVIFTQSDKSDFITFENNGTRIQAFATDKKDNGKIYENNNLNVRVNGDSIILRQGGQMIEMVRE